MLQVKPRINKSFHIEKIEGDKLLLLSDEEKLILEKSHYTNVLTQITENKYTVDQLIEKNANEIPPHIFFKIYDTLLDKKFIVQSECQELSDEQIAFWEAHGYDIGKISNLLAEKSISVQSIGIKESSTFTDICNTIGLTVTGGKSNLHIVIADKYSNNELSSLNKKMLKSKTPWLLLKPSGKEVYIGPIFNGSETACWECLNHRLYLHNPVANLPQSFNNILHKPYIIHSASESIAYNIAVLEIMRFLYNETDSLLIDNILMFDTLTLQTSNHTLAKRPQCHICGNSVAKHLQKIKFSCNQTKIHSLGGFRSVHPEETFEKYKHHISKITGIVPFVKPCIGLKDGLIHNFTSGQNLALQSRAKFWLNNHFRSTNGGKGKNDAQAKTGALCEAIERYCMIYHDTIFSIKGSFGELENAIHPNNCMNFSKKQYSERTLINKHVARYYSLIPEPFDENASIEWTPLYSLTSDVFKYLPTSYCYAQYPYESENDIISYPDSNGCASGNTLEEAFLQGFLELVERDAVALWWYNRIQRQQVDLLSANNPYIDKIIAYYESLDREIYVLDLSSDIQIPVFVALSYSRTTRKQILFGFGCHVDATVALERAVVEMNQLLPIVTENIESIEDKTFSNWLANVSIDENAYLRPLIGDKIVMSEYVMPCEKSIYHCAMHCVNSAKKNNLEVLVLDLTQPDIGMPVVRVVVPGLRHFWKRTAPGRLYDVPVQMGWLKEKLTEEELNPIEFFL